LLTNSTFEESNALSAWLSEQAYSSSITRVASPSGGGYVSKFLLKKSDPLVAGSYRAEIKTNTDPKGAERWYGMKVFLPSSYAKDPVPESIFQWHNTPNFNAGEDWGSYKKNNPWRLETNNGRLRFVHQFNTVASDPKSSVSSRSYDLGEYKLGEWINFVVHYKATHTSDGILEMWKNGTKVLTINGPGVYYNDETGPYFKMGIYKWGWSGTGSTVSERTLYWDDVKIGNQNSSYNEVAPGGSTTTPTPTPTPTPAPTNSVVYAVNGGGSSFAASNGVTYQADKNFSGGFSHSVTNAIANTVDDALFQKGHYGTNFTYNVPVANGTYDVVLHFTENYNSASGKRQFDVLAEGKEIISNLDIFKAAGSRYKAYSLTKTVTVTDGTLNLNFRRDLGDAMVAAFHLVKK
jgi:hypothetical protein